MSKKRSKRKQNKNTIVVSSLADALVTAFALTAEESPRKKGVRDRERARVRAQNPIPEPKRRLTYEYEEENFDDYEPDILNEEPGFDAEAAADDEDDRSPRKINRSSTSLKRKKASTTCLRDKAWIR
ncbi:hypothetical protein [Lacticaseibacillus sharpeae]|uniref:hypothetical protein n=1 Tax=Lacticaseibacillus sharpeae TaxID=1626 RepID=UPI0006CFE241|nr:hypothetical protein [Lacticaseibacillus sharpeae]